MFSPEIVIHVEKVKREREYEELQKSPRSPFKDKEMWVIFLSAMMVGYREKTRTPLKLSLIHIPSPRDRTRSRMPSSA